MKTKYILGFIIALYVLFVDVHIVRGAVICCSQNSDCKEFCNTNYPGSSYSCSGSVLPSDCTSGSGPSRCYCTEPDGCGYTYYTDGVPWQYPWGAWRECDTTPTYGQCWTTRFCTDPANQSQYQISSCVCGSGVPNGGGTNFVNCSNLNVTDGSIPIINGVPILTKNQTYALTANYYLPGMQPGVTGYRIMTGIVGTSCSNREFWFSAELVGSGDSSFDWTPITTGTYTIYCLSSATAYASCEGYVNSCDSTDYACGGPGASMTVNVIDPITPTPTPIPNNPPSGTLSCPSQIFLGQSGTFTLNGSDANGNLSSAGLYYSPTSNQSWSDINGNIPCTGSSCTPPTQSWTPTAAGTYYVAANYYDSAGGKCTGNPWTPYPSGWVACGNPNSVCTVNVIAGRIQGRRVDECGTPAGAPTITVSGVGNYSLPAHWSTYSTGDILSFGSPYTVSSTVPTGFEVLYSECDNCLGHPDFTSGSTVNVTMPSTPAPGYYTAYVDLYWKYRGLSPTCSISANPSTVDYNSASTINWSSAYSGSYSCTVDGWTGTSGSQSTGNLKTNTTYTESCTATTIACGNCSDSTTVTVRSIPPPVLTCITYINPVSITWDWNILFDFLTYWLQVWGDVWKVNDGNIHPPVTTRVPPGITYHGRVKASDGSRSSSWGTASCTVPALDPPPGDCGSFNYDPVNPATPITYNWHNGTGLQVWDSTGHWWYNSAAPPDTDISFSEIPPGRTVYARTTYSTDYTDSFTYFSTPTSTTCPLPENPPDATINGKLQQKSGLGCYETDAGNTINVTSYNITTSDVCVHPSCTDDGTNYTCTIDFQSNSCLPHTPPTWPISVDEVTLHAVALGYGSSGWTMPPPPLSCSPFQNTIYNVAAGSSTTRALTFDFPNTSEWYKLKSASFVGPPNVSTSITIPAIVNPYDSDDNNTHYFIIGEAGSVLRATVIHDPPDISYSLINWNAPSYPTFPLLFTPSSFLSYVKSRKEYVSKNVSDIENNSLEANKINFIAGDVNIDTPSKEAAIVNKAPLVIIVTGNIAINLNNKFNSAEKSVALISTGEISFSSQITEANGLFIAQTVNTGTNTSQGLKIKGNLIAQSSFTNGRSWSDTSRPSVFIVFDQKPYLDLLPYLSIANYEWRQIQ